VTQSVWLIQGAVPNAATVCRLPSNDGVTAGNRGARPFVSLFAQGTNCGPAVGGDSLTRFRVIAVKYW
jgi:hypothetical protein